MRIHLEPRQPKPENENTKTSGWGPFLCTSRWRCQRSSVSLSLLMMMKDYNQLLPEWIAYHPVTGQHCSRSIEPYSSERSSVIEGRVMEVATIRKTGATGNVLKSEIYSSTNDLNQWPGWKEVKVMRRQCIQWRILKSACVMRSYQADRLKRSSSWRWERSKEIQDTSANVNHQVWTKAIKRHKVDDVKRVTSTPKQEEGVW